MAEAFCEARTFFHDLDVLVASDSQRTWAEVAVLHDPFSASLFGNGEIRLNLALHQYLLRRGIPFHIVLPGKPLPESARVLVAFHVGALSAERLAEMKVHTSQHQRSGGPTQVAGIHLHARVGGYVAGGLYAPPRAPIQPGKLFW